MFQFGIATDHGAQSSKYYRIRAAALERWVAPAVDGVAANAGPRVDQSETNS